LLSYCLFWPFSVYPHGSGAYTALTKWWGFSRKKLTLPKLFGLTICLFSFYKNSLVYLLELFQQGIPSKNSYPYRRMERIKAFISIH
ncbi:hypothetical protein, partial [Geobacillus zalihae]|uniref:hypothetical protein n=1 Tax=Geobacillus zalihae TaxID=213419 RepID=UPI001A99B4D0